MFLVKMQDSYNVPNQNAAYKNERRKQFTLVRILSDEASSIPQKHICQKQDQNKHSSLRYTKQMKCPSVMYAHVLFMYN